MGVVRAIKEYPVSLSQQDMEDLKQAALLLENPGLAARITDYFGKSLESGLKLLPEGFGKIIHSVSSKALQVALETVLVTLEKAPGKNTKNTLHKLAAVASGGVGGFFGISTLPVELPISTSIMLRSIVDIARNQGEIITAPETKMACIEVFALGGKTSKDDHSETGYYAVRTALAKSVTDAVEFLTAKGMADKGAPQLLKLIASVASRFGIQVTEKVASQAVPVIGAAGGAIINMIFINHFQDMARGHFIVRRLERIHGRKQIQTLYENLAGSV